MVVGVRVRPVGLEAVLVAGGVARVGAVAGVVVGTGLVGGANTGETPVPPTRLKWQVLGASKWHGCRRQRPWQCHPAAATCPKSGVDADAGVDVHADPHVLRWGMLVREPGRGSTDS